MPKIPSPNYTQVPNVIFDNHLADLNESELKVLLCIIRLTTGYQCKRKRISLKVFETITGIKKSAVSEAAKHLEEQGFIEIVRSGLGECNIYRINKESDPFLTPRRSHIGGPEQFKSRYNSVSDVPPRAEPENSVTIPPMAESDVPPMAEYIGRKKSSCIKEKSEATTTSPLPGSNLPQASEDAEEHSLSRGGADCNPDYSPRLASDVNKTYTTISVANFVNAYRKSRKCSNAEAKAFKAHYRKPIGEPFIGAIEIAVKSFSGNCLQDFYDSKSWWRMEPSGDGGDSDLDRIAAEIHDRHPSDSRCGKELIKRKLKAIRSAGNDLAEVNESHARHCESVKWKNGFANSLERWLDPARELWKNTPYVPASAYPEEYSKPIDWSQAS